VSSGLGGWLHYLKPRQDRPVEPILVPVGSARKTTAKNLDTVYRALLEEHLLTPAHQRHLVEERQLGAEAIRDRGYKSWGYAPQPRYRLARQIYDLHQAVALDVPGIIVRKQKGPEYVTLAGSAGIAIPVRDVKGRVIAMQIRADDPKYGKYQSLSSASQGGASSGTPVHVARPRGDRTGSGRVWLTEGPLKADIACEGLSEVVLAVLGVNATRELPETLKLLRQRGELRELVIALDSDWHTKEAVASARLLIAERAARQGIPVWLADWDPAHKGLDDLLLAGGRPKLHPYQVQGNGPRRLEDEDELRQPTRPAAQAMTLEAARQFQTKRLEEILWSERGERDRGILIRSLPGVGKSHALTSVLNRLVKKARKTRALVFVPRHDLSKGVGRESWETVRGRTHQNHETPAPPCHHGALQARLSSLRIPGQMGCEHCPALALCKSNQAQDPAQPFYHAQFEKKAAITVHPVQHFLMPSLLKDARVVALDDCDLRSLCIEDVKLSRGQLEHALYWAQQHPNHAYAQAKPLLELLVHLGRQVPMGEFRWQEVELFQVLESLAQQHLKMDLETVLELAGKAQEPDPFSGSDLLRAQLDVPIRFVRELCDVLGFEWKQYRSRGEREWEGWNARVRLVRKSASGEIEFALKLRRDLPLKALEGKDVVIVDASLSVKEAQALFPHKREWFVIDPHVEMPSTVEIVQIPDQAWGKLRLQDGRARKQALAMIGQVVAQHPGESIALLTHKGFSLDVKRGFPELRTGHFYGQRGSNEFQYCDVEIVFGTPYPNLEELMQLAQALYWDESPVLRQVTLERQSFETAPRQRRRQVAVRTYVDPRLAELLRAKCQEELLQAVYRIRPLSVEVDPSGQLEFVMYNDPNEPRRRAKVYLFCALPLPGLTVQLVEGKAPPAPRPAQVICLHQAAQNLTFRRERITEERLAREASTSRNQARRFLTAAPHSEKPLRSAMGAVGPPPANAPPQLSSAN